MACYALRTPPRVAQAKPSGPKYQNIQKSVNANDMEYGVYCQYCQYCQYYQYCNVYHCLNMSYYALLNNLQLKMNSNYSFYISVVFQYVSNPLHLPTASSHHHLLLTCKQSQNQLCQLRVGRWWKRSVSVHSISPKYFKIYLGPLLAH